MAHLVALDPQAHRHLRIDTRRVEAAGATLNMVPVVLSEFLKLVVQYPIAFTKDKDTGRFVCVALFGFHDNENLFVENGQWSAIYVPLQVARQPFFLGAADESGESGEEGQFVVCIDVEHDSIRGDSGEQLFDTDGNETPYLHNVQQGLAELLRGEAATRQFTEYLARLKLLLPMQLEITFDNQASTEVAGLYTIDEARLAELAADEIAGLHAQGYLAPLYTMLASLGHIYSLIDKRNRRNECNLRLAQAA
jgi:hypothetical protein